MRVIYLGASIHRFEVVANKKLNAEVSWHSNLIEQLDDVSRIWIIGPSNKNQRLLDNWENKEADYLNGREFSQNYQNESSQKLSDQV